MRLNLITKSWNTYFLSSKYLQSRINFNEGVQLNYYGDILFYFKDTLELLKVNKELSKDFGCKVFYAIGLLQIIFVQQDLIDELLSIFSITCSSKKDKNPNRRIRNELIGHPINREAGKLQSSSIFGNDLSENILNYIKYDVADGFIGNSFSETYESIINRHINYLDKYFEIIWSKILSLLKKYKVKLLNLENAIINDLELEKVVELCALRINKVLESNYLFKKEIILECNDRKKEHLRYSHAVELFMNELKTAIKEESQNINKILISKITDNINGINSENDIVIKLEELNIDIIEKNNNYSYELSKLHDRHPVFGISFFKDKYIENKDVIEELINMEQNPNSDLEYYCSFELIKRNLLNN